MFGPQGGCRSTMKDLSKFMRMLANGGTFNGVRVISSKAVEQMLKPWWIYNGHNGDTLSGMHLS